MLMGVALGLWATPFAQAMSCNATTIHDYAKPLNHLPPVQPVPLGQHPHFAPNGVELGRLTGGPLQPGPSRRGFILSYSHYGSTAPSRRLDWRVTARLTTLDRHGRRKGLPQTTEKRVRKLRSGDHELEFAFDVPGKPAIYRLEIVFEDKGGKRLARFGEYFRVLRPSVNVDFFLEGTSFHRGETVQPFLANRGAAFLSFGLELIVEYNDEGTWTQPPVAFPGHPVPAIGLVLGPGERGSCWSATIPPDAVPGTYRLSKTIGHSTSPRFEARRNPIMVSAEFTVTE